MITGVVVEGYLSVCAGLPGGCSPWKIRGPLLQSYYAELRPGRVFRAPRPFSCSGHGNGIAYFSGRPMVLRSARRFRSLRVESPDPAVGGAGSGIVPFRGAPVVMPRTVCRRAPGFNGEYAQGGWL